jgi:DNA-binding transcriptional regulator YdaS (Cro superfamily)
MDGLNKAITYFGSRKAFASAIGVTPMAVSYWVQKKRNVTPERAIEIEKATNGAITRSELRPDLWPSNEAA